MSKKLLFLICILTLSVNIAYSVENENVLNGGPMLSPLPPVELISFNADQIDDYVLISWSTATEYQCKGFYVEKRDVNAGTGWEELGFVEGAGNSSTEKSYSYSDTQIEAGKTYAYRLRQTDLDASEVYSNETEVTIYPNGIDGRDGNTSNFLVLNNAYPNPASDYVNIDFDINIPSHVKIEVLDIQGNLINNLANELMEAGEKSLQWKMDYSDGAPVPAGTYIIRLITGDDVRMIKVIKD